MSKSINIVKQFNVTFAVRAGGHSPNPGWSSIGKNGILLDLQHLDTIALASNDSVLSVGPGARWGAVQEALQGRGTTVIGARNSGVGVGGVILGGMIICSVTYGLHFIDKPQEVIAFCPLRTDLLPTMSANLRYARPIHGL